MTIVHLQTRDSKRTDTKMRGYSKPRRKYRELYVGLAVTALILTAVTVSAFNGGFSMEAGQLQMTLDASFTEGLKLSFISI